MKCHTQRGERQSAPSSLAAKLAAIWNYECPELLDQVTANPRLVEILWFLQAMSLRRGGLLQFVNDLLAEFPERIGTPRMLRAKANGYSLEDKIAICQEMPAAHRPRFPQEENYTIAEILSDSTPNEIAGMRARDRKAMEVALKEVTADSLKEICRLAALEKLPEYFTALCTQKAMGFNALAPISLSEEECQEEIDRALADAISGCDVVARNAAASPSGPAQPCWFFHDVMGALTTFMTRNAAKVQQRLAMTEVVKRVFDTLDYALAEKVMVRIEGGTRFGKTEALSAWADMRPGLARLVRVPRDNSMVSFFKRIGEALGIDCSYGSNPSHLKERVEFVIQHGGLFLLLDEGHFLAPVNFTAATPPHRLNWVRTEIVDRGLPLAVSATPQAFKGAIDRFVKKTRYDMAQFFGREFLCSVLPEALSESDLIAVARIHFPGLGENALGYIANEARLSQNYLQAVEAIARRARFLSSKRGGGIKLKDIQAAVCDVLARSPVNGHQPETAQIASQASRARITKPAIRRLINEPLTSPSRGVQPVRMNAENDEALDSCSLRGAGRVRVETELVSAQT